MADIVYANATERPVTRAYQALISDRGPPIGYLTVARRGDRGPFVTVEGEVKVVSEPNHRTEDGKLRRLTVGKRRFLMNGKLMALEEAPGEWDQPRINDFYTVPVWSLDDVFAILATRHNDPLPLLGFPRAEAFFVHGAVNSDKKGELLNVQRLVHERVAEVRGVKRVARAALKDAQNTIFCLDIENVDPEHFLPGVEVNFHDREYVVRLLRAALPAWIANSRFLVQLSSSHGFKGLRARVFIHTSIPLTCGQLKTILDDYLSVGGRAASPARIIDNAGLGPAQPVYINTTFESPKRGFEAAGTYKEHWFEAVPDPMNPRVFKVGLEERPAIVPQHLLLNEQVTVDAKTGKTEVKVRSDAMARERAHLGRMVATGDTAGALTLIDVDNIHNTVRTAAESLLRMQPVLPEDTIEALILSRLAEVETEERAGRNRADRLARLAPGAMVHEVRSIISHYLLTSSQLRELRKPSEAALVAYQPQPGEVSLEEGAKATKEVIGRVVTHAKGLRATKDALRVLKSTAPLEERRALADRLQSLLSHPVEVLSTSTGVGKSHALTEALAEIRDTPVRVALVVPDHDLAAEHADRLQRAGVSVLHYQGLERLCRWMTLEGDPIAMELQGAKTSLENVCNTCPLRDGCPYPEQHKKSVTAQVTIIAGPRVMFEPLSPLIKRSQAKDEVKLRGNMQSDAHDDFAMDYMHLAGVTEGQFDLVVMDEAPVAKWLLQGELLHKQVVAATGLTRSDLMTTEERAALKEPIEAVRAAAATVERRFVAEDGLTFAGAEKALQALREAAYGAYWKVSGDDLAKVFQDGDKKARRRVKAMLEWNKRLDALIEFAGINPEAGYRRLLCFGMED